MHAEIGTLACNIQHEWKSAVVELLLRKRLRAATVCPVCSQARNTGIQRRCSQKSTHAACPSCQLAHLRSPLQPRQPWPPRRGWARHHHLRGSQGVHSLSDTASHRCAVQAHGALQERHMLYRAM